MPHMMPMMWIMIYFFTLFFLMIIISLLYFFYLPVPALSKFKNQLSYGSWIWLW